MTVTELRDALHRLGLTPDTVRVLPMLPLVQVAWADGRVQRAERGLILEVADRYRLNTAERALLLRWLDARPHEADFLLARRVLLALWERDRQRGAAPDSLHGVLRLCRAVANVAGGVLGLAFTLSREEQDVLIDLARSLRLSPELAPNVHSDATQLLPRPPRAPPYVDPTAPTVKRKRLAPPTLLPEEEAEDLGATLPLASLRRQLLDDEATELDLPHLSELPAWED